MLLVRKAVSVWGVVEPEVWPWTVFNDDFVTRHRALSRCFAETSRWSRVETLLVIEQSLILRWINHPEVAFGKNFCIRWPMRHIEACALVFHTVKALLVMPWVSFRTSWICMVVIDRHWDTCSVVYYNFVLILLPCRSFLGLVLDLKSTIKLRWTTFISFKPWRSRWA